MLSEQGMEPTISIWFPETIFSVFLNACLLLNLGILRAF